MYFERRICRGEDPDDSSWFGSQRLLPANINLPLPKPSSLSRPLSRSRLRGYDRSLFPIFRVPGRFAAPTTRTTMINIDAATSEVESMPYLNYANFSALLSALPTMGSLGISQFVDTTVNVIGQTDVSSCRNNARRATSSILAQRVVFQIKLELHAACTMYNGEGKHSMNILPYLLT